jgi:hypothetical protein
MPFLKSTIKIESIDLFPSPLIYTAINNNVIDGDSRLGSVRADADSFSELGTGAFGALGAYVYLRSSATNTPSGAINIYSSNFPDAEIIATLWPGETAFIPIPSTYEGLYAKTTFGLGDLEYVIANRGGAIELESSAVLVLFTTSDNAFWQYYHLDSGTGKPAKHVITSFSKTAFTSYTHQKGISGKGFVFKMINTNSANNTIMFIDAKGNLVDANLPSNISGYQLYNFSTGFVMVYTANAIVTDTVIYFDGNKIYKHHIESALIDISGWDDEATKDGSIVVNALRLATSADGPDWQYSRIVESSYIINKDKKTQIWSNLASPNAKDADQHLYSFGNFIVQLVWDSWTGWKKLETINIFNTSGVLIKTKNVLAANITNVYTHFYGSGKIQLVCTNRQGDTLTDNGTTLYMFNYNEKTNVLIGENLNWTHTNSDNTSWKVKYDPNWYYENANYLGETVVIAFWNYPELAADPSYVLSIRPTYLDIQYVFDGDTNYSSDTLANNDSTYMYNLPYQTQFGYTAGFTVGKEDFHLLRGTNTTSGELSAITYRKGAVKTITTLLSDQSAFNTKTLLYSRTGDSQTMQYIRTGDYNILSYSNVTTNQTFVKVYKTAILDTLTLPVANEIGLGYNRNSIFFKKRSGAGSQTRYTYYFNINTNTWVEINAIQEFIYAYSDSADSLSNGHVMLIKYDNSSITARTLINGVLSPEKVLYVLMPNNLSFNTSTKGLFLSYPNVASQSNIKIDVYDWQLNFKYSVQTDKPVRTVDENRGSSFYLETKNNTSDGKYTFLSLSNKSAVKQDALNITNYNHFFNTRMIY